MAKKVMLIGENPSIYSLSPAMWNASFFRFRMDIEYIALDIKEKDIEDRINSLLDDEEVLGFNVTNPYKEVVAGCQRLKLREDAKILGAVNTVVKKRKKIIGYSTDGYGAITSLNEHFGERCLDRKEIMVLGAGGSGSAVALSCSRYGNVAVANRTLERAEELSKKAKIIPLRLYSEQFFRKLEHSDVIINTIPIEKEKGKSILEQIPGKPKICLDVVYGHHSYFLEKARERGHGTLEGKWMLLHQAVKSFEYLFRKDSYIPMKAAIINMLLGR